MIEKQIEELIKKRIIDLKLIDTGNLLSSIKVSVNEDGVTGLYDWLENEFTLKSYYNQTYANNIISILQQGFY